MELDEFTINKIICFNSTPKHTIYVGVRENSESYVTEFYYDCPICDKTILLGDESRFKPHCEFSNKFLFIDKDVPYPKMLKYSFGKRKHPNQKKWINNIKLVNIELLNYFS